MKQILINHHPFETRMACLVDGEPYEFALMRPHQTSLVGNLYLGVVRRVLPDMSVAFVDIGQEQLAFLPLVRPARTGEWLLLQVKKDPIGQKAATMTTDISLVGRFLVYLPTSPTRIVFSTKLPNSEQQHLQSLLATHAAQGTWIVRTNCHYASAEMIMAELAQLAERYRHIQTDRHTAVLKKTPILLSPELPMYLCFVRDLAGDTGQIWVDDDRVFAEFEQHLPAVKNVLCHYKNSPPLFVAFGVEQAWQNALARRVELPSGGYLIVDETEAMTTIDVNSGSCTKSGHHTNTEASVAIARTLRQKNLSGIIVLDFISTANKSEERSVLHALQTELAKDNAQTQVLQSSKLGLVEMTRTRSTRSLSQSVLAPCPVCAGSGRIKSPETVAFEIVRALLPILADRPSITIQTSEPVAVCLYEYNCLNYLQSLATTTLVVDIINDCSPEHYRLIYV